LGDAASSGGMPLTSIHPPHVRSQPIYTAPRTHTNTPSRPPNPSSPTCPFPFASSSSRHLATVLAFSIVASVARSSCCYLARPHASLSILPILLSQRDCSCERAGHHLPTHYAVAKPGEKPVEHVSPVPVKNPNPSPKKITKKATSKISKSIGVAKRGVSW